MIKDYIYLQIKVYLYYLSKMASGKEISNHLNGQIVWLISIDDGSLLSMPLVILWSLNIPVYLTNFKTAATKRIQAIFTEYLWQLSTYMHSLLGIPLPLAG